MWRCIALGALIFLALTQAALPGDQWICLRSAHFELYTTSPETSAREAILFFEQVRRAFTETLGLKLPEDKPITMIAFHDEASFAPYRPQENITAYTMFLPTRDFIVMQDLSPEHYHLGLHEYTHAVINQAGMKLPLWLDEGFAEVFATMKPEGHRILVGRIIPGRLRDAQAGLLDLREVLATDRRSPLYHEGSRTGIYYGESWALVHMLKFSDGYSPRFERLMDAIGSGQPSDQALEAVYGKSIPQIQKDLENYVHGDRFREGVIKAKLAKPGPPPQVLPVDPLEMAVLLTGVRLRGPHRPEALQELEQLIKDNPGKNGPIDALAWAQINSPDRQAATAAFRRAVDAGTRDARLCFQFAVAMRPWIPDADYVAALRRAAEINPDYSAAQQQLAAHAFNARDYTEAIKRFHLVKKLERGNAFMYYRALSFAAFQVGDLTEAKSAGERAQQFAVTPEDKRLADEMLRYVNGRNPSTAPPAVSPPPQF